MKHALLIGVLLALAAGTVGARDHYAPLPQEIATAHTAYLDNQSKYAIVADHALKRFTEWGKYRLVDKKDSADIVFVFVDGLEPAVSRGSGVILGSNVITRQGPSQTCNVTMTIYGRDGSSLWINTKPCSRKGAVDDLVIDLRKRLEAK